MSLGWRSHGLTQDPVDTQTFDPSYILYEQILLTSYWKSDPGFQSQDLKDGNRANQFVCRKKEQVAGDLRAAREAQE
jgi:hypothetical protein